MVPWLLAVHALTPDAPPRAPLSSVTTPSLRSAAPTQNLTSSLISSDTKSIALSKVVAHVTSGVKQARSTRVRQEHLSDSSQQRGSGSGFVAGILGAAAVWFGLTWYNDKGSTKPNEQRQQALADVPLCKAEVEDQRRQLLKELDQLKAHEQRLKLAGMEDGTEEAKGEYLAPSLEEYDRMLQEAVNKAAAVLAPKIVKGEALRSLAESRVTSFAAKAQAFVVTELNEAAGEVCEVLDVPEAGLFLDKDSGGFDKMPGISVVLAGVLSPFVLQTMLMLHATQLLVVLLPYCCLVTWALYTDYGTVCPAIPTMRLWLSVQVILNYILIGSRAWLLVIIYKGQQTLQKKIREMKEDLLTKHNAGQGLAGMKDLIQGHFSVVRQGLVEEDNIQTSVARHLVGACTLVWSLATLWTLTLVIGWATVPGQVNYSHAMSVLSPESFCGAWATVLTARVSALVAVLIFISNVGTVLHWLMDLARHDDSLVGTVIKHAKTFDNDHMGFPIAQLLAKAFLLRDTKDMTFTRLALASDHKSRVEKDILSAQRSLEELKAKLSSQERIVSCLQKEANEYGDPNSSRAPTIHVPDVEDSEHFLNSLRERGREAIQSTKHRISNLEFQTDHLDTMVQRINEGAEQLRNSQAYQSAIQAAREGSDKIRSSQAYQSAIEATVPAAELLQEAAGQAAEQLQNSQAYQTAMQAARDGSEKLRSTQAYQSAVDAASPAAELLQETAGRAAEQLRRSSKELVRNTQPEEQLAGLSVISETADKAGQDAGEASDDVDFDLYGDEKAPSQQSQGVEFRKPGRGDKR